MRVMPEVCPGHRNESPVARPDAPLPDLFLELLSRLAHVVRRRERRNVDARVESQC